MGAGPPTDGNPRVSVDRVEAAIDNGTKTEVFERGEFLQGTVETSFCEDGKGFGRKLEPDDGVGAAIPAMSTIDHPVAVLKDEVLKVIVAPHNSEWGKMMGKEEGQANIENVVFVVWE